MGRKSKILVILVVILALLVIGLSGFIVYDRFINKEFSADSETKCIDDEKEFSVDSETKCIDDENIITYKKFTENLKKQISKYDQNNTNYQFVKNDIIEDGYEIYLDEKGSLFVKYFNNDLNKKYGKYKVADKVLNFYVVNVGQDVGNMIFFINEDGTVSSANTEYDVENEIKVNNNLPYKNIVSIINGISGDEYGGGHGPIFIDIDGNIFK